MFVIATISFVVSAVMSMVIYLGIALLYNSIFYQLAVPLAVYNKIIGK